MARKRGMLSPEDFEQLSKILGLEPSSYVAATLYFRTVEGWSIPEIAQLQNRSEEQVYQEVTGLIERWEQRVGYSDRAAVAYWRTLLELMQGHRPHNPATPNVGFDPNYPSKPEYARTVQLRGKMLTAEDLALGEGHWRETSLVETAHQGKRARRVQREKKERRKRAREERPE